jgi:hypothetical protein
MADGSFGLSFSPTGDQTRKQPDGNPVQSAIQTLGLSMPRVVGGPSAVAPGALLTAPGGGGLNLQALLALLFGSRNPSFAGGGATTGLTPKVTPVGGHPAGVFGMDKGSPFTPPSGPAPSTPRGPDFPMPSGGGGLDLPQPPATQAPAPAPSLPMGGRDWLSGFRNQS